MSNYHPFLNQAEQQALVNWYARLEENRVDRARLRRAENPEDILLTEAFFHFLSKMPPEWSQNKPMPTSACLAGALSHVKTYKQTPSRLVNNKDSDAPKKQASFAEQLATPMEGKKSKAPMSELRFQQLQKSPTREDFYRRIIRAIRLLDGKVNILSLANDILQWHREFDKPLGRNRCPAERLAVRWATDYFLRVTLNSN